MAATANDNLAVLIDADNAQASIIHELLAEVSRYGTASVKRAYGDWTTPSLKKWKDHLHESAIQPIQQFSYTTGKNSTDSALIIDAMDLLHAGGLNGFCLGLVVYGFGERKTPKPFVAACDKFIYSDILKPAKSGDGKAKPKAEPLKPMISEAINAAAQDDGWANLGTVGSALQKTNPSFDPRNYGCQKLGELVRKQKYIAVKDVPVSSGSGGGHILIRMK